MSVNSSSPRVYQNELMTMQIGETFFQRWQNASKIQKIGLFGESMIAPHAFSSATPTFPTYATEDIPRSSFRYQIGEMIFNAQWSIGSRLCLPYKFITLGKRYRRQQATQKPYKDFDIGLPHDPLMRWPLPANSTAFLKQRQIDLTAVIDDLENNTLASTRAHLHQPVLYISGMPKSPSPSGYGVRTNHILEVLRQNDIKNSALYMGFNLNPSENKNLIEDSETSYPSLGAEADLANLIETAVSKIMAQAKATESKSLASGSNWLAGYCTLKAARELGLPFLYDVRGMWHYTRSAVDPTFEKTASYALQDRVEFALLRAADQVFVISEALKKLAIDKGVMPERIAIAPNGIAINQAEKQTQKSALRQMLGLEEDVQIIGYAGSVTDYEQLHILIEALSLKKLSVVNSAPTDWHLVIAGKGPALAALKTLATEKRINAHISFLGHVSKGEVNALLEAASVMAYPRSTHKTFQYVPPLKPLEPMLQGTLCLFSDIKPHQELVGSDQSRGVIVTSQTAEAWKEAIDRILLDPEKFTSIGQNASAWVQGHRALDVAFAPWVNSFKHHP